MKRCNPSTTRYTRMIFSALIVLAEILKLAENSWKSATEITNSLEEVLQDTLTAESSPSGR